MAKRKVVKTSPEGDKDKSASAKLPPKKKAKEVSKKKVATPSSEDATGKSSSSKLRPKRKADDVEKVESNEVIEADKGALEEELLKLGELGPLRDVKQAAEKAKKQEELPQTIELEKSSALLKKTGVIYLGHIPHGFYEDQMRGFFSQFGTVSNLKLSRSKKTGNSRGYAFIQFESEDVARIVEKTMHKYILGEKVLECKYVEPEKVHDRMFAE